MQNYAFSTCHAMAATNASNYLKINTYKLVIPSRCCKLEKVLTFTSTKS